MVANGKEKMIMARLIVKEMIAKIRMKALTTIAMKT